MWVNGELRIILGFTGQNSTSGSFGGSWLFSCSSCEGSGVGLAIVNCTCMPVWFYKIFVLGSLFDFCMKGSH